MAIPIRVEEEIDNSFRNRYAKERGIAKELN